MASRPRAPAYLMEVGFWDDLDTHMHEKGLPIDCPARDDVVLLWPIICAMVKGARNGGDWRNLNHAWQLKRIVGLQWSVDRIDAALILLQEAKRIKICDHILTVQNWSKHQFDPTNAERQQKYRERREEAKQKTNNNKGSAKSSNGVTVTHPLRNENNAELNRTELNKTPPYPPAKPGGRGGCENREPGPDPSPPSADWFAAAEQLKFDAKWATWIWGRSRRLRPKLVAIFPDDMPGVVFALACALDKELSARQGYGDAIRNPEAFCRTVIESGKRWPLPERPEIPWPGRQANAEQWESYTSLGVKYAGVDYDLGAPPDWKPLCAHILTNLCATSRE